MALRPRRAAAQRLRIGPRRDRLCRRSQRGRSRGITRRARTWRFIRPTSWPKPGPTTPCCWIGSSADEILARHERYRAVGRAIHHPAAGDSGGVEGGLHRLESGAAAEAGLFSVAPSRNAPLRRVQRRGGLPSSTGGFAAAIIKSGESDCRSRGRGHSSATLGSACVRHCAGHQPRGPRRFRHKAKCVLHEPMGRNGSL